MSFPVIDRDTLTKALGKMNHLDQAQLPHLSEEEIIALHAFLEGKIGSDILCEKRRDFIERIQKVLERFPKPTMPEVSVERRRNEMLRIAVDRIRHGAAVTEGERNLVLGTLQHLQGRAQLDQAQTRLRDLLESILGLTQVKQAVAVEEPPAAVEPPAIEEPPAVEEPTSDSQEDSAAPATCFDPATAMADRERESVTEYEGVPINRSLRVLQMQDSFEWKGPLEETDMLESINGSIQVRGDVSGVIVAKGDIIIHGGLMGGIALSTHGGISAGRVAASARMIAQRGVIDIEEGENHELVFAAGDCRVAGNISGGALYGATLTIAGTVRDAHCHTLSGFDAQKVAESSQGRMRIHFRQILLPEDYGLELDDDAVALVRTTLRSRFRLIVSEAWQHAYMRDKRHAQLTALYALKAGAKQAPSPQALRNAQIHRNYLEVLIEIARRGLSLLLRAADGPSSGIALVFASAVDDVASAAKVFEKEIELIPEELARQAKPHLLTATRHLVNAMKKTKEKDSSAQSKSPSDPLRNLEHRIVEWQQELEQAIDTLEDTFSQAEPILGKMLKADHDQLDRLLNKSLAESGPKATSGLLRMMRSGLERINPGIERWEASAATARIEYLGAKDRLLHDHGIRLTTSTTEAQARAEEWGRGVELWSTRPRAGAISQESKLVLDTEYPPGTTFALHGLSIKPAEPKKSDALATDLPD